MLARQASARPARAASIQVSAVANKPRPAQANNATKQLLAPATLLATFFAPSAAFAADGTADATIDSAVSTAVEAIKSAGGAVKAGAEVVSAGLQVLKQGYDVAAPVAKRGYELAAPALQQAADLVTPALQQAAPAVTSAAASAVKAAGVDVGALGNTAREAADLASAGAAAATPALGKVAAFLADKDPLTLGEYGLGAAVLTLAAPSIGGLLAGGLRGYAGDLTPVQALDALANEGSAVLIDVRSSREKESSGLPEVASSASGRVLEVAFAATEDRKLRGALRDPSAIELKVTALTIAGLKRVSRGSRVIILDRSGGQAKAVARELAKLGFGRAYVVQGGFEAWVRSKLLVKPAATSSFAGATGGGALPAALARTLSTRPATPSGGPATRRALPAGR